MFSNKKIGGIRFIRLGRLNVSVSVKRATVAQREAFAKTTLALSSVIFAASGVGAALVAVGVI